MRGITLIMSMCLDQKIIVFYVIESEKHLDNINAWKQIKSQVLSMDHLAAVYYV